MKNPDMRLAAVGQVPEYRELFFRGLPRRVPGRQCPAVSPRSTLTVGDGSFLAPLLILISILSGIGKLLCATGNQFTHPGSTPPTSEWEPLCATGNQFTHPGTLNNQSIEYGLCATENQFTHPGIRDVVVIGLTLCATGNQFTHPAC
jgi:hypothetical protein